MRTIAIVNQKGGSAKTTTSVNLAATLAEQGRRVLIVDLDPQHSATTWFEIAAGGRGIYDLFAEPETTTIDGLTFETSAPGVWLVPSSSFLVGAEKALATEPGAEQLLREKIGGIKNNHYDYLLVDCPPTLGVLTVNALTAVKEVIVPVECHVMGLHGLAKLEQIVELIRKRLNAALGITGIVVCRVDQRTKHSREVVEKIRERFPTLLYKTLIRENVRLAECPSQGVPITIYAGSSNGAEDYRSLATEVIAQEGKRHV